MEILPTEDAQVSHRGTLGDFVRATAILQNELDEAREKLKASEALIKNLEEENKLYRFKMEYFRLKWLGTKSERRLDDDHDRQRPLFETTPLSSPEGAQDAKADQEEEKKPPKPPRAPRTKRKNRQGMELPDGVQFDPSRLRHEVIEAPLPEDLCTCPECTKERKIVDWREQKTLAYQHGGEFYVKVYRTPVVSCGSCSSSIEAAPLPVPVLDRVMVDGTFFAHLIVQRVMWSLPFYRQARMLDSRGIFMTRDTLICYFIAIATLLRPIFDALVASIQCSRHMYGDETEMKVALPVVRNGRKTKKYKACRFWGFLGERDEVAFFFAETREGKHVSEFVGDGMAFFQCDGYSGYKAFAAGGKMILVFCWAHARRKFVEAEALHPVEVRMALRYIRLLYKIEDSIADATPEERLSVRRRKSARVLRWFKRYLLHLKATRKLVPKDPLTKAIEYALRHWEGLVVYTTEPFLDIDSNRMERLFRLLAIGRNNVKFASSKEGAEAAAIFYSLIQTCVLQHIDPYIYLADVIDRISVHSKAEELIPREWKTRFEDEAWARYGPAPNSG